jgi:hypothetical protein
MLLAPLPGDLTVDSGITDMEEFPFDSWYDLPFYAGYFIFSTSEGVVLGYIRSWRHDRWLHHGLSLAFAGSILAALNLSALELPDLAFLQLDATATWPKSLSSSPFSLLPNDSSHWFVYNHESGILAIDHPENTSQINSIRFYQTKRPTLDVDPDDGRVNYDQGSP